MKACDERSSTLFILQLPPIKLMHGKMGAGARAQHLYEPLDVEW